MLKWAKFRPHACKYGTLVGLDAVRANQAFPYFFVWLDDIAGLERSKKVPAAGQFRQIPSRKDVPVTSSWSDTAKQNLRLLPRACALCD